MSIINLRLIVIEKLAIHCQRLFENRNIGKILDNRIDEIKI
jgi:hypothetical protein